MRGALSRKNSNSVGVKLKPAFLHKLFTTGHTVPTLSGYCKNHVENFLLSSTIRNKPAGQHGDPDPTGAAEGGVGGGREEAETGGSWGPRVLALSETFIEHLLYARGWAK